MGAFDLLFKRKPTPEKQVEGYFQMLNGYTPVFSTYDGGVYEMELVRSCIHAFATHCSKLLPNIQGADLHRVKTILEGKPNPFMTTAQFLYKTATIYEVKNTCYIVPLLDEFDRLTGFYPVNPQQTELIQVKGEPWLRFTFNNGKKVAFELYRVGVLSKYLYNSDIQGEDNQALRHTLQLIHTQNQGIEHGIKNSAAIRFMATIGNLITGTDLKKKRREWVEENLSSDTGGLALFDSQFTNVQQIQSQAKIVDPEQMKIIDTRVLNYFGSNEDILQNKAVGDKWSGYYEGKIEPFAIQLSLAMTMMTYTNAERARQNAIVWSANRLQYMTNADKLNVSAQMFDRGLMNRNMIMDIWNLPHVDGGDKFYIRRDYIEIDKLDQQDTQPPEPEEEKHDTREQDQAQE